MNKVDVLEKLRNVLFLTALVAITSVAMAQEPNVWLYGNGRVTHEIDADSIAVIESDVPVLPGYRGLFYISRYVDDESLNTENVLYIDGKEVELIDPETGNKHRFQRAAVNDKGDLFILSYYYEEDETEVKCMWKNGEIFWKEIIDEDYSGISNIIFDGDNVYVNGYTSEFNTDKRKYFYKKNDEELIFYHTERDHYDGWVEDFTVEDDIIHYCLERWTEYGTISENFYSSIVNWFYVYHGIGNGSWLTTPDKSYDLGLSNVTYYKGDYYACGRKYFYWDSQGISKEYFFIVSSQGETVCEYDPQRIYFDEGGNMWVHGWLIDKNEDGIDDYYGYATDGIHFWKNGSYYERYLYQKNLVTEYENDEESVESFFMCDDDFYAIMRTPNWDDNGNEIRCKSALVRNEKPIWVIDGFINKVLFY